MDDGRLAFREAREHHVQSHVLVHTFAADQFGKAAAEGLASAQRAHEAGEAALQEIQVRRRGLAVATLLVVVFLIALGLKIRSLGPG